MRFIDDLRSPGARLQMPFCIDPSKEQAWTDLAMRMMELLRDPALPVLRIDNVADYYYGSEQEYWDLRDDFPNLAPPFPAFWAEFRMVKRIHSKERGDTDVAALVPNGRVGMLIHGLPVENCKGENIPENVRWILWCELWVDYGQRGVTAQGPHGSTFFAIDAEGVIVERPWMQSMAGPEFASLMPQLMVWFNPVLLAISFLHCKNVSLIDNRVPAPLAKKYRARSGIEPCAYKTLIIEPLKKILHGEGRAGEIGIQRALHICRGHFRDYRDGRGLFGKYHVQVWQPAIIRGTKGQGKPPAREIEVKV